MVHVKIDIPSEHHISSASSQNNNGNDTSPSSLTGEEAPENQLTMFITIIAMLEKASNWLGKLMFALVTMMMLRAFTMTPQSEDFVFVAIILLLETFRNVCCGSEPELHHQASCHTLSAKNTSGSRRLIRTIQLSILFIYWYKLVSALVFVILSVIRLVSQNSGQTKEAHKANWDLKILNLFYVILLGQALMLLAEKTFWEWKVNYCGLLEKVNAECGLEKSDSDMISIKRFLYYAYSKILSGNIFDNLNLDLVTFAQECLDSNIEGEQLIGIWILRAFLTNQHMSDSELRKIRTSTAVIERLIEMLNWKNTPSEEEMRYSASVILSELADVEQNAVLVAGIPRAMKSISSLLYSSSMNDGHKYNSLDFNLLGLLLLRKLAKEHENCAIICNTDGLLNQIIYFTSIGHGIDPQAVMRSLQVLKILAGTRGKTGLACRQKISEVVFMGINIREILCHGSQDLKRLALEVLTNLAMDREARILIGKTGGLVNELVRLFFRPGKMHNQNMSSVEAGEALAMLILENRGICNEIHYDERERILDRLTEALKDPVISVSSSRILHNLCAVAGPEWSTQLSRVVAGFTMVLNAIMEKNGREWVNSLEISLGLAVQMLKFTRPHELTEELRRAFLSEDRLVKRLVRIIAAYRDPSVKAPQIRKFAIKLTVEMMKIDKKYVKLFKDAGIARKLSRMTRSELESFNIFSGNVGQINHQVSLDLLLDEAFELLT